MSKVRKSESPAVRYVAATGAPISSKDAEIIGAELRKIAEAHACNNIRQLDKHVVMEEVERDRNSPLRNYLEWDDKKAGKAYRLQQMGQLIRSIRIVPIKIPKGAMVVPQPMFFSAENVPRYQGDKVIRHRAQVLSEDALNNDPIFMSILGQHIRRMMDSFKALERVSSARAPEEIQDLVATLREVFDQYQAIVTKQAAE